jgi:hypothetical protein
MTINPSESSIAFTCSICKGSQPIPVNSHVSMPICNECLKDLGEIIAAKRKVITGEDLLKIVGNAHSKEKN